MPSPSPDTHPELHRRLAGWHLRMAIYHLRKCLNPNSNQLPIPEKPKQHG